MKWLKAVSNRFKKSKGLYPECLWTVSVDDVGFHATDQTGRTTVATTDDLTSVVIATDDSGPWGADVWYLMYGADGHLACGFPQGATGEQEVLDALMALPDFDHGEMTKAMSCTSNATFIVWQRKT